MKKQYKAPKCIAIEIDEHDIIATSPTISGKYSDTSEEGLSKRRFVDFSRSDFDDEESF